MVQTPWRLHCQDTHLIESHWKQHFLLLEREGQGPVFGKALSLRALICVYQCPLSMSSSRASSPSNAKRPPPGTQAATNPLKYNLKLNGAKQIALCL